MLKRFCTACEQFLLSSVRDRSGEEIPWCYYCGKDAVEMVEDPSAKEE